MDMRVQLPTGSRYGRVRMPWYATMTFVIVGVAALILLLGETEFSHAVAPLGILLGDMVAGFLFLRGSRNLASVERRAWTLVGIGLMVATSGIGVLAIQVLLGFDPPTFGISDAFFVAGYVIILVGMASLPHTEGDALQRGRVALDGVVAAISIGALTWVFILEPIATGLDGAPLVDRVFGVLYVLVDILIIVVVIIVTLRRSMLRFDIRLILFSVAVTLQGIADVSYLIEGAGKSFVDAQPLYGVYLVAAAFFLLTALNVDNVPQPKEFADRRSSTWALVAPYSAATIMIIALASRLWDDELTADDQVLLIATLLVGLLVVARQGISIRENRALVEQQRSDLVSSISHELRTPLTAMVGFLEVVKEDSSLSKAERIEMVEIVADQAAYLERIVEDLLALAHGVPDRMDLDLSECTVAAIIENAILATTINRRHVEVEVKPGLTAVVDGNRLQQIMVNLLSNAARYGGDRCLVVAYAEGSGLIIEIHDSGPGVPKKHEITIWERFERGQNRYNAVTPGSGIGLAMVKSIADSHGGTATYRRSDRLGGACFVVELPGRVAPQRPVAVVPGGRMAIG